MLILDSYKSYITPEFIQYGLFNNILLLHLLPFTSHILQPLDVSLLSSLKTVLLDKLDPLIQIEVAYVLKLE